MSLVVFEKVSLAYGAQRIFASANLRIDAGDKLGLIGPNGAGKSTLLRLLTEQVQPDEGTVRRARYCQYGYLPQDIPDYAGVSVLEAVLSTVPGRREFEERLETDTRALEATEDADEQMRLAQCISDMTERLNDLDTLYSEHQAVRILNGLGFSNREMNRGANELSGGWRMRVALAGLLFQQPDLLLLDEPTNHLDMRSVLWLDGFLGELRSALILVCHDRNFLNRHVERVVSLEPEGLRSYRGNYDEYLVQRAEEEEVRQSERKNQERRLEEMERFVERFRSKATKARQAQSRARRVKRLKDELRDAAPVAGRKTLSFRFPVTERSGRRVVELKGVTKSFGANTVYRQIDSLVERGDRIAIVGRNGAGKTTLLRMIAGELATDDGRIVRGANVSLGYYAQHHSDVLQPRQTVLDEVWRAAPSLGQSAVRSVCGAFLFTRDEVEKTIGVLSGGERARVLLARLLVNPGNLLLMDEPTNHLDISASEALADALRAYDGTLIFVSHNSAFVETIANRIWDVRDGTIYDHRGDFDSWRHHLAVTAGRAGALTDQGPTNDFGGEEREVPEIAGSGTTVSSRLLRERQKSRGGPKAQDGRVRTTVRRRKRAGTADAYPHQQRALQSTERNVAEAGQHNPTEPRSRAVSENSKAATLDDARHRPARKKRRSSGRGQSKAKREARIQELRESISELEQDLSELPPSHSSFSRLYAKYCAAQETLDRLLARGGD